MYWTIGKQNMVNTVLNKIKFNQKQYTFKRTKYGHTME